MYRLALVAALLLPLGALAGPPPPAPAAQPGKGAAAPKAPGSGAPSTAPAAKPSTPPPPSTGTPPPPGGAAPGGAAPGGAAPGDGDAREPVDEKPVDLGDTWHYSKQRPRAPRYQPERPVIDSSPNPTGYYGGVSLGGNHVPPFPAKQMGTKPVVITWIGFERVAGGSRVYLELNNDLAYEVTRRGLVLTVRLPNTKVNMRNNTRVLDLRYFQTPVRTAKISRRGRDSVVTITLKRAAEPTVELVAGNVGYKLLVVKFGGGASEDDTEPSPPPPPSKYE